MDLTNSGKVYVGDVLLIIEELIKEGSIMKDKQYLD
jgi:hypothetical protein